MLGIFNRTRSAAPSPPPSPRGAKRSADTEQLLPASAPAVKLHKDSSGDVFTSATVTAGVPTDAIETSPAEDSIIQLPRAEWQALLARVTVLERAPAQLAAAQSQLTAAHSQLAATEATFDAKLQQQTQDSIAREGAIKDTHRQQVAALEATVEFLNRRVRSKNMVLHGVPDTAAISRPADLEHFVKCRLDDAAPGRGPSVVSQSVTAVTHIGKPGGGNRAVLVEYVSSQAKLRAYALSRESGAKASTLLMSSPPNSFKHSRLWNQTALPSGQRATVLGTGVGLCGIPTRVSLDSAGRAMLSGIQCQRVLLLTLHPQGQT